MGKSNEGRAAYFDCDKGAIMKFALASANVVLPISGIAGYLRILCERSGLELPRSMST